jgi:transposase-like protein
LVGGLERREAERSEAERSGIPPTKEQISEKKTEVLERPERRHFSATFKLKIIAEADRLKETKGIGAMLRREGIYWSMLAKWRKQKDAGALYGLEGRKRGPQRAEPNPLKNENERLQRENRTILKKLKKAEAIIEFQKKVAALLEATEDEGSA